MPEFNLVVGKVSPSKILMDPGSGAKVEFFYRLPTNQERLAYGRRSMIQKGKKVKINVLQAAIDSAKPLITSFSFPDPDPDTQIRWQTDDGLVPLSCQEGEPGYHEQWPEVLAQAVPGMVEMLGLAVFTGVKEVVNSSPFEIDDGSDDDGKGEEPEAGEADPK